MWQLIIPVVLVIVTLVTYGIFTSDTEEVSSIVEVERGTFEIVVSGTGELEALASNHITIPEVLINRTVRIRSIEITDLVREGTFVEKGDYVATLDPGDVEERMQEANDRLTMYRNNETNVKIDSSLVLSEARDEIRQAADMVEQRAIEVQQSIYESAAFQRQAKINLETAQRLLDQRVRNYGQILRRHELFVQRAKENVRNQLEEIEVLEQLRRDLRITAPGPGLVVYARGHDGQKIRVGSHVNRWAPLIATLPDLSTLKSVVNIKEIDISKIRVGLPVRVRIDIFPDEEFEGVVSSVANIGQEVPEEFFNAFKVEIEVNPRDKVLLPGMTSVNNIIVESIQESVIVPRMAVFRHYSDGQYVYKRDGFSVVRQQIKTSGENDLYFRVESGLQPGDRVLLNPPDREDNIKLVRL